MDIEVVITSLLKNTAGISRIYPTIIPRDVQAPFTLYTVDAYGPIYTLTGATETVNTDVEIEIFAETLAICDAEFAKIRDNLSGINQTVVGDHTVNGFTIQSVFNSYEPELRFHVKTINVDVIITKN